MYVYNNKNYQDFTILFVCFKIVYFVLNVRNFGRSKVVNGWSFINVIGLVLIIFNSILCTTKIHRFGIHGKTEILDRFEMVASSDGHFGNFIAELTYV